jgi:hypothetical protein
MRKRADADIAELKEMSYKVQRIESFNDDNLFKQRMVIKELQEIFNLQEGLSKESSKGNQMRVGFISEQSSCDFENVIKEAFDRKKADQAKFKRSKESLSQVVNFRDCRPGRIGLNKQQETQEGEAKATKTEKPSKSGPKQMTDQVKSVGTSKKPTRSSQGFVKHVGHVNYVEKGPLTTNINNKFKDPITLDDVKKMKDVIDRTAHSYENLVWK